MDEIMNEEPEPVASTTRKLKLRRETLRNLTEDILSTAGESLWTCPGLDPREDPEPTFVQIDAVRVEVHVEVRPPDRRPE
ncbi:hypothetical protein [Cellulomonas fengjieae]|uniref:Uncharacterized protein n=1 Tax=Cellulomonas fengjieae TaxID=2819978 RepID=A0ABS3SG63_9CELL|nr:hypothetical protein [Cellulomonas fengjieae]MBO3083946.1 hypothetical protein [Cellulomonas fengjieae]MBO3101303.1 hypothetical protein [Cellulomonas fengjieae]QVI64780.1 hypothetical protein KG102_11445 [Cellulomonas fengjieae]